MNTVSFINGDSLSAPELQSISQLLKTLSVVFLQCKVDSLGAPNDGFLLNALKKLFRLFRVLLDL